MFDHGSSSRYPPPRSPRDSTRRARAPASPACSARASSDPPHRSQRCRVIRIAARRERARTVAPPTVQRRRVDIDVADVVSAEHVLGRRLVGKADRAPLAKADVRDRPDLGATGVAQHSLDEITQLDLRHPEPRNAPASSAASRAIRCTTAAPQATTTTTLLSDPDQILDLRADPVHADVRLEPTPMVVSVRGR